MEKATNVVDVSNLKRFRGSAFDAYEELNKKNQKRDEIIEVSELSKNFCKEKNIDVNGIIINELYSLGFKIDISSFFLSKLIEEFYHERKAFDCSDYFDLSYSDNEHYSKLQNKYGAYPVELYRGFIAKSIAEASYEEKNINNVVLSLVDKVSKKIETSKQLQINK